jgi:hypothetical protein
MLDGLVKCEYTEEGLKLDDNDEDDKMYVCTEGCDEDDSGEGDEQD